MNPLIIFDIDGVIVDTHPVRGTVIESILLDLLDIVPTPHDFSKFL